MLISSAKNELIKHMKRLKERSYRRETGLHLIEGERLVFDALKSGVRPEAILVESGCSSIEDNLASLGVEYISVTRNVLESVADTPSPQGICASVRTPSVTFPDEKSVMEMDGLYVALDRLQDPGNLGTVIRTADAMGAKGIFLGTGCTDAFSPKALRSAMGSTYHLPVFCCDLAEALPLLTRAGFTALCGHLEGAEGFPQISKKCVIVIGNEGNGVSAETAAMCTLCRLPMYGRAESLNASVAASIFIYEAAKQLHGANKAF